MIKFAPEMLKSVAPHLPAEQRNRIFSVLIKELHENEIDTYLRVAAFLGQTLVESREFTIWEENLNYSAKRLCQVWPNRFPTIASATPYANNPRALAEKVYSGRMGNYQSGDGYKYRGRGPEQTTGKSGYAEAAKLTGLPLVENPDLLLKPEAGFKVAAMRWKSKGFNALADTRKFKEITLKLNGGLNGYPERVTYYTRALRNLPEDLVLPENVAVTEAAPLAEDMVPDVLLPTESGVMIPAVVTDTEGEDKFTFEDIQNVVTGHSDSVKAIVGRFLLKLTTLVSIIWSVTAGKIFLILLAIILVSLIAYEISKYWPKVKGFVLKFIRKN